MPSIRIGRVSIGDAPRIVATITAPQKYRELGRAKAAGADLVELRLDYVAHLPEEDIVGLVANAAKSSPLPLIATIRAPREGGARRDGVVSDERRREALFRALLPHVQAVDVELSSPFLADFAAACRKKDVTVIVSYHHFRSTPPLARLRALAQLAKAKGADIVKVVAMSRTPVEMMRLFSLLQERPVHPLTAFAVGPHALLSRIMAHLFHSSLLYGWLPLGGDGRGAPGQPTLAELKSVLRQFKLY